MRNIHRSSETHTASDQPKDEERTVRCPSTGIGRCISDNASGGFSLKGHVNIKEQNRQSGNGVCDIRPPFELGFVHKQSVHDTTDSHGCEEVQSYHSCLGTLSPSILIKTTHQIIPKADESPVPDELFGGVTGESRLCELVGRSEDESGDNDLYTAEAGPNMWVSEAVLGIEVGAKQLEENSRQSKA